MGLYISNFCPKSSGFLWFIIQSPYLVKHYKYKLINIIKEMAFFMKKYIVTKDKSKIIQEYPLDKLVKGWFFKCEEISNGFYLVEGVDLYGRKVTQEGTNPDELLKSTSMDAKKINN